MWWKISVEEKSSFSETVAEMSDGADGTRSFLHVELEIDNKSVSQNDYLFKRFKELAVSRPENKSEIEASATGF